MYYVHYLYYLYYVYCLFKLVESIVYYSHNKMKTVRQTLGMCYMYCSYKSVESIVSHTIKMTIVSWVILLNCNHKGILDWFIEKTGTKI